MIADGEISSPLKLPASPWDYRVGETLSYFIEHPEGSILHHSVGRVLRDDTLKELKPDTIVLTIANRISSEDLIQNRVLPSGARRVIPVHWDNFFKPMKREGAPLPLYFQKPEEFDAKAKALMPGVRVEWPEYCKGIDVKSLGTR